MCDKDLDEWKAYMCITKLPCRMITLNEKYHIGILGCWIQSKKFGKYKCPYD